MLCVIIFLFFIHAVFSLKENNITASSETLIWMPLKGHIPSGIESAWEAFILVPVDYESDESPLIPINIKKFQKPQSIDTDTQDNIWFIPGGPGQSSRTLDVYMDLLVPLSPPGAVIYAIDHRGLGKSTPLANALESEMLKRNDRNPNVLPEILDRKQKQLGLVVPLTKVLRVENVARDLIKGVQMVKSQDQPKKSKNYVLSISYGTVIARRAVQIEPEMFEAVIFDGLAALERIEISNEADKALEDFCQMVPSCRKSLGNVPKTGSHPRIRSIIPTILSSSNQCTQYFASRYNGKSVCKSIHVLLNAALLQGLTVLKVAALRILFEMTTCADFNGFQQLLNSLDWGLQQRPGGNGLQSAAIVNPTSAANIPNYAKDINPEEAISINEFVFEVISAIERYHITPTSIDICFNKKHSIQGDDKQTCPSRLFDPCRFFHTTFQRKRALSASIGELPDNSVKNPVIQTKSTRLIVLAGLLDFNTPTALAREIFHQFFLSPEKYYYEFSGLSHGIFGASGCEREIFQDLVNGGNRTAQCLTVTNNHHISRIDTDYFDVDLTELARIISLL